MKHRVHTRGLSVRIAEMYIIFMVSGVAWRNGNA